MKIALILFLITPSAFAHPLSDGVPHDLFDDGLAMDIDWNQPVLICDGGRYTVFRNYHSWNKDLSVWKGRSADNNGSEYDLHHSDKNKWISKSASFAWIPLANGVPLPTWSESMLRVNLREYTVQYQKIVKYGVFGTWNVVTNVTAKCMTVDEYFGHVSRSSN